MFSATDQESRVKLGWWLVLAIWALLTIVGEIIVFSVSMLLEQFSEEAHIIDHAYVVLPIIA